MILRRQSVISICGSLALLLSASCRSQNDATVTNNSSSRTVVSTAPPFQTREPERYRATRTITSTNTNGQTNVSKFAIAKDGEFRRLEGNFFSARMIFVTGPQGKFLLLPDQKLYVDQSEGAASRGMEFLDETSPEGLLHAESGTSSYQQLGPEVISGRKANKYLVVVNGGDAASVSSCETLIWIDEAWGMPIKSETKSPEGSRSTMELSELSLNVDKNLFQVPGDYKKITFAEIARYLAPR